MENFWDKRYAGATTWNAPAAGLIALNPIWWRGAKRLSLRMARGAIPSILPLWIRRACHRLFAGRPKEGQGIGESGRR